MALAADHGVAAEGVSAYPREVTAQMVLNFLAGGAAVNVLARLVGARVVVADMGVDADLPNHAQLRSLKIRRGTASITQGPAMSVEEAQLAKLRRLRADRDQAGVSRALDRLRDEARGAGNLMEPILEAVRAYATLGEMAAALKDVFGEHKEPIGV